MKNKIHVLFKLMVYVIIMHAVIASADNTLPKGIIALDGKPAPALKLKNMDGGHLSAAWTTPACPEMHKRPAAFDITEIKGLTIHIL